jgi:ABC-2 type transport system ATP-binding protein
MSTELASLAQVSKRFGATLALDKVSLQLHEGKVLALLGANGAGKTTAISMLTGLAVPDTGSVMLLGGAPTERHTRADLGVMLQECALPELLTVRELIQLFSSYYPNPRTITETLQLARLESLAGKRYGALSGGQKRRVQFGLAICARPKLVLVDEPTVGLDVQARQDFWAVSKQLKAEGTAMLLTTHYLEEADVLADHVVVLARGQVLVEGTPETLKARYSSKKVRFKSRVPLARWRHMQFAAAAIADGDFIEFQCDAPERCLLEMLELDPQLSALSISESRLEDAFLAITGFDSAQPAANVKEAA